MALQVAVNLLLYVLTLSSLTILLIFKNEAPFCYNIVELNKIESQEGGSGDKTNENQEI